MVLSSPLHGQLKALTTTSCSTSPIPLVHRAQPTSPDPSTLFNTSVILEENCIKAGESRCAVCKMRISRASKRRAIDHINTCWGQLRVRATDSMTPKLQDQIALPRPNVNQAVQNEALQLALTDTNVMDNISLSSAALRTPVEGLEKKAKTPNLLPHNATAGSSQGSPAQPTLPYYQSPNPLPPAPSRPSTACIICNAYLLNFCAIDAMLHVRQCLNQRLPPACPVCRIDFALEVSPPWTPDRVLEHLDYCECRGDAPRSAHHDAFVATMAVFDQNRNMAGRFLIRARGAKKSWGTRDHIRSFKAKTPLKYRADGEPYRLENTPLRMMTRLI